MSTKEKQKASNQKRTLIKRLVVLVLLLVALPLLWWLIFVAYPMTTLTDISGVVKDKGFLVATSGRGAASYTYLIKLDNYQSPLRLEIYNAFDLYSKKEINVLYAGIENGAELRLKIQRKKLEDLNSSSFDKPLSECRSSEASEFPRAYEIRTNTKTLISSAAALFNTSTLALLGHFCKAFVLLAVLAMLVGLYRTIKKLYILCREERNTR